MFEYIYGKIDEIDSGYIVLDNGKIGYKIYVSEHTMAKLGEIGEKVKIYTHYHVREDNISLYGFMSNEELKMFELLLQVSGIGAKTAIAMLSNITPSKFALAIISNDLKTLTKIPGIGNKSAQRMVLELKDKLKTQTAIEDDEEETTPNDNSESINEAGQALQILGYNKSEISKVFDKFDTHNLSTEDLIKEALKRLAR